MKSYTKIFLFASYWICGDKIFEIRKNQWCRSYTPYYQESEWIF